MSGTSNLRRNFLSALLAPRFWWVVIFLIVVAGIWAAIKMAIPTNLYKEWAAIFLTIEKTLAVIAVSIIVQMFYSLFEKAEEKSEIEDLIKKEFSAIRNELLPGSERHKLFQIVDAMDFDQVFRTAPDGGEVCIFFTFHPDLSGEGMYERALKRGVAARLLLADPESPGLAFKFDLLQDPRGAEWRESAIDGLRNFLDSTTKRIRFYSKPEDQFLVRIAESSVDIPLVIVKDSLRAIVSVYSGFYSFRPAVDMPWIQWQWCGCDCDENMAGVLAKYFEMRWERGRVHVGTSHSANGPIAMP
ncbi:hypothetical protein GVN21_00295 [Caulobacter sp. SLTY]|uniref:hypothetical protein n=1 Tax=Caulobacter sp. SLTY TaxID=2683262 RepID=UPI001412FAD6|nr:hypothetical protein [Caulobacter sp. SLTY]NBB13791.1 hypothetical protein [Caulobacter sp. SLTY]